VKITLPRAPARIWVDVLKRIMPVLAKCDANDVILFGSQAMSVYMERALASKDIDLIVPAISIGSLEKVGEELAQVAGKKPTYDYQVSDYLGRRYPIGHIYLTRNGFPFVVEFFQTFLGYESVRLTAFLALREKWGLWIQTLSPEAVIGTRLAFRPPERITPFNATRLNRLIRTIGTINWSEVNTFIDTFELRTIVQENLAELKSKGISIMGSSKIAQ
jgi:predicted nucleotidyltransferase